MKAEDFRDVVGDYKWSLGITSRVEVEHVVDFVIALARHSDNPSLRDDLIKLYDEVENIETSDLVAVGCDDYWWKG